MQDRLATQRGDVGGARRSATGIRLRTRALAGAFAAAVAISTGTVVALAGDRRDGSRHQHMTPMASLRHGAAHGPAAESGEKDSGMLEVLVSSSAELVRLLATPGTSGSPRVADVPEFGGPPTDEQGLGATTPATPTTLAPRSAPLRTGVTHARPAPTAVRPAPAALPATGGPAAPGLHAPLQQAPDIVLIPPAALPAPAVIKPAHAGVSAGPLVGLVLSLIMLGGLLGLRLARRQG